MSVTIVIATVAVTKSLLSILDLVRKGSMMCRNSNRMFETVCQWGTRRG